MASWRYASSFGVGRYSSVAGSSTAFVSVGSASSCPVPHEGGNAASEGSRPSGPAGTSERPAATAVSPSVLPAAEGSAAFFPCADRKRLKSLDSAPILRTTRSVRPLHRSLPVTSGGGVRPKSRHSVPISPQPSGISPDAQFTGDGMTVSASPASTVSPGVSHRSRRSRSSAPQTRQPDAPNATHRCPLSVRPSGRAAPWPPTATGSSPPPHSPNSG